MWAILFALPTIAFGAYKFSSWCAKRSHNNRMNRAHERLLAEAETVRQAEQWSYRMHNIALPANAVVREERNPES